MASRPRNRTRNSGVSPLASVEPVKDVALGSPQEALEFRRQHRGIIGVGSKVPVRDSSVLSLLYTPGVAEASTEISRDSLASFDYTCRGNTVAILTDGSRVLDMAGIGPEPALPVMESKSVIFKTFAGIDAFPICLDTQELDAIVQAGLYLAPTFGGIHLEDIAAPKCFAVLDHLQRAVNLPVYQDEQHSAAIEVLAGLLNALKIVGKRLDGVRIVISGAGAAGIATAKLLLEAGAKNVVLCDREGAVYRHRLKRMNWAKAEIARRTNLDQRAGPLADMLVGADVLIGFSGGNVATPEMVRSMASDPIVFALANPVPEIRPELAREAGARLVATALSDHPNQIVSALVYPGFFRGLLDVRARNVNTEMMIAAARALANRVSDQALHADYIVPKVLDMSVVPAIAEAVAQSALETGEAQVDRKPGEVAERALTFLYEGQFSVKPRSHPKEGSLSLREEALELRRRYTGTLEVKTKVRVLDHHLFSMFVLPPGASEPARVIARDPSMVYELTAKSNLVAIVTDGSAVLGLGNIGPRAALPVMEGKAILFNTFAGVEAFPICLATQEPAEIVDLVKHIAPTFGGVNLEDISAPRCFIIEEQLKKELSIPVFHDDQHGTAIVVLAGLMNAMKLVGRKFDEIKIVINGAGAAGIAVARLLLVAGASNIVICDRSGAIYAGREVGMNRIKEEMAAITNPERLKGPLNEVVKGSDVLIGVSSAGAVTKEMVRSMAKDSIIFALANPVPEIMPDAAEEAGAKVVATGRSDLRNQVNNCLAFPGLFRGALDSRARAINDEMKVAAARAIAELVGDKDLEPGYVIPAVMDFRVPPRVAAAVARAAVETGEARVAVDPDSIEANTRDFIYEGHLGGLAR